MDNPTVIESVSDLLSVRDLVTLGCCSKYHEKEARKFIGIRMQQLKASLAEEKRKLYGGDDGRVALSSGDYTTLDEFAQAWGKLQSEVFCLSLNEMLYEAYLAALSMSFSDLDSCRHKLGNACQGGGIFLTSLHCAAATDDVELCSLLLSRGASVNPNISIPNDGESEDKSAQASNRDDGSDFSQYRWGMISPLRLALMFGHSEVSELLRFHGGDPGEVIEVTCEGCPEIELMRMGGCDCQRRNLAALPNLPGGSCWVKRDSHDEIYYTNNYHHGQELNHHVLFTNDLALTLFLLQGCGNRRN